MNFCLLQGINQKSSIGLIFSHKLYVNSRLLVKCVHLNLTEELVYVYSMAVGQSFQNWILLH